MARVGLLGGTFNPPHIGHLICAQEALVQLELDRVLLVPTHVPPHKVVADEPGPLVRLELCERAVAGDPRLGASSIELDRPGPSYTVDTLAALRAQAPGDELTFIVGGDMAHSLLTWREPERVLELACLGVAERADHHRGDLLARLSSLRNGAERVRFFEMPRLDISSSLVRRRARAGLPLRYLVPEPVADLVEQRGLYRVGETAWAR